MVKNMKTSKDAIRAKLAAFAAEWSGATLEKQEAQQFFGMPFVPALGLVFRRYSLAGCCAPAD
jgi:hypothetical protein